MATIMELPSAKIIPEEQNQVEWEKKLDLTNHLKFFFNYAYYLGVTPMKFALSAKNGKSAKYIKVVWKPQQIACGIMHILCIFQIIYEIREKLPASTTRILKRPTLYFGLVLNFCIFFYKLVCMKRFWLNSSDYAQVLNTILHERHLPIRRLLINKPAFLHLIYILFAIKIAVCVICGFGFVIPISNLSFSWWLRRLVANARTVFCFYPLYDTHKAPEFEDFTLLDCILSVVMIIAKFSRFSLAAFCDLHVLSFSLTLWTTASSFANHIDYNLAVIRQADNEDVEDKEGWDSKESLEQSAASLGEEMKNFQSGSTWAKLFRQFQAIQNLSDVVSTAMGSIVVWYLFEGLMYYSIHLNTIFITNDWFKRFYSLLFFVITYNILYISADICNQMESAKSWLVKKNNIQTVPMSEAYLVLHEIITKDIGIRGNNTFTITFPFVAGYLSVIVTFFIICVQEGDA